MIEMRMKRSKMCLQIACKCSSLIMLATGISIALTRYQEAVVLSSLMNGPLAFDDPRLLSFINSVLLVMPGSGPYNLKMLELDNPSNKNYNFYLNSTNGFPPLHRIVKAIFDDQPPGFFIEAGALDGEFLSNTLYLEKEKGWQGLLVEPDNKMFNHLLKKNRKAWAANCCLSSTKYPSKETLIRMTDKRGPGDDTGVRAQNQLLSSPYAFIRDDFARQTFDAVQCVPLQSLLKALRVTHVEFVSLDIEGVEEDVLENFFTSNHGLEVDVWLVEHHKPGVALDERDDFFIQRFTLRGYALYTIVQDSRPFNYVFVRNSSKILKSAFEKRPQEFVITI